MTRSARNWAVPWVAPRMGSVDWNLHVGTWSFTAAVAPRMGSVDWNPWASLWRWPGYRRSPHGERGLKFRWYHFADCCTEVAPRMGSVDWNRRKLNSTGLVMVAPRMGSVDWNIAVAIVIMIFLWSLPAWGAWIEIMVRQSLAMSFKVAPRMGSVDWNKRLNYQHTMNCGRSPHGERGLKLWCKIGPPGPYRRSPHGERGLKCTGTRLLPVR